MDYEEFCAAMGNSYSLLEKIYGMKKGVGQQVNRKLMHDIRIYMAVGGMPVIVVNEKVVSFGKVLSEKEVTKILGGIING